MSYHKLSPKAF